MMKILKPTKTITELFQKIMDQSNATSLESYPNAYYDNAVIPTDNQWVWFEEGVEFAERHPSATCCYRVYHDYIMYYIIGNENEVLSRLRNLLRKLKGCEIDIEKEEVMD